MTQRSWQLDPVGVAGGAVFLLLSLTPSLLPRNAPLQGLVSGITFALGYALVLGLWRLVRRLTRWSPSQRTQRRLSRVGWPLFGVVFVVASLGGLAAQHEVRRMVELPPLDGVNTLAFILTLTLTSAVGLGIGWLVKAGWRRILSELASRGVDAGRAERLSILITGVSAVLVLALLAGGGFLALDRVYAGRNGMPGPEVAEPASTHRSAGPGSEVVWDELGRHGAAFVGGGPTAEEISALTGQPALTPIRVYVGIAAGGSMADRAATAARELERTGAFERDVLVLGTVTGSGWLEPQAVDAVEYLHSGNTAIAALQYAYTPSFVSSLTAPDLPAEATAALFDAVQDLWAQRPADERPQLVVYGLSLGSDGIMRSFGSLEGLVERTDGALFVGPVNSNPLWRELQASRDPGSAAWQPVLEEGRRVRWASGFGDFETLSGPWEQPRIAILQHSTDPITWLGPELLWSQPEWLTDGNRAPDISPHMHWIPGVTAVQVALDMAMCVAVPARHGHAFGDVMLKGWVGVTGDGGLDTDALASIQTELETYWTILPFFE